MGLARRLGQHHSNGRLGEVVLQFVVGGSGVGRHHDSAERLDSEPGEEELRPVRHVHAHEITSSYAALEKPGRDLVYFVKERSVGPTLGRSPVEWHPDQELPDWVGLNRSEEPTSELQSLMRYSYAFFFLKTITSPISHTRLIPYCKHRSQPSIYRRI